MSTLLACDSLESLPASIPEVPQLSVDQVHRGAFLGVWGLESEQGSEKVWFVGGEVLNANESHSMIASYTKRPNQRDALDSGTLQLEYEGEGGVLWWVWGSPTGQVWAAGEQGTLLSTQHSQIPSTWSPEAVILEDDLKEKLVIWGVWGTEVNSKDGDSLTQVWAVGGSVRRGGPKGVLLKRNPQGEWYRIRNDFLPVEATDDPLQGGNLYKIWGDGQELWIVGEGSLTLKAKLQINDNGIELVNWEKFTIESDQAELLFTVAGPLNEDIPNDTRVWLVGGYAKGKAWYWENQNWTNLTFPQVPSLNGVAISQEMVLASGNQGLLMAWPHDIASDQSERIHQQWVRGAETMTLHSIWPSSKGEFWIVGGDLTTMQSGVIITPQAWQATSTLQVQAW